MSRTARRALAVAILAIAGSLCGGLATAAPRHGPSPGLWLTTADQKHLLERQPAAATRLAPGTPDATVTVRPDRPRQRMVGFGAALTDASAYVIRHDLPPARSRALMRELFAPDALGLSFVRLTIGASDFSPTHYSYDDVPAGADDPQLSRFSIAPARADVLPLVREARSFNPRLTLMASPWSAPGWMKTSGSLIRGQLRPQAYDAYARYFVRYLEDMRREGAPIWAVTVQNEPGFEPADYPGMLMPPAARARFDAEFLGPALAAHHLTTRILEFDHNWNEPESPTAVLSDPTAARYISGVAWHCYKGDVSAQLPVRRAFPTKDAFFTECSGGEWAPDFGETFDWMMQSLMIGSVRGDARGVLLWNLALDETHGPHLGGCANCRGVVTVDSRTGEVRRNVEYYALGHLSRFVEPGAWRLETESSSADVSAVAFRNPDGRSAVVLLNTAAAARRVRVTAGGAVADVLLPARAAATLVMDARRA